MPTLHNIGTPLTETTTPLSAPVVEKPKRARNADGGFVADDKSTDGFNEAWVGGKAPAKKKRGKK